MRKLLYFMDPQVGRLAADAEPAPSSATPAHVQRIPSIQGHDELRKVNSEALSESDFRLVQEVLSDRIERLRPPHHSVLAVHA